MQRKCSMDKYDSMKLENQACFLLYACSKEIVKLYNPLLDELNLTYTQYITMMVMWEHKKLLVKEIGEYLCLDSGTLTPVLKKLEDKGFLARTRSKEDERDVVISITPDGEVLKERALSVPERLRSCIKFGGEDANKLAELLKTLLTELMNR